MAGKVRLEVSARHLHLTQEHLEILFGKGAKLNYLRELSIPGQYLCEEKVEVVGPKSSLRMSVLGPVRPATQIEISLTDARSIGVTVPIRESGVVAGSAGCTLVGPAGKIELKEGLIAALRHIHTNPVDAAAFGVKDRDFVSVKVESQGRSLVFDDVLVRVHESFITTMHIDTDEAHAAFVSGEMYGEVIV